MTAQLTHFVIPAGRTMHEIVCRIPQPDGEAPGETSWGDANLNHLFTTTEGDGSTIVELLDEYMIVSPSTGLSARGETVMDANEGLYLGLNEKDPVFEKIAISDKWLYTISKKFNGDARNSDETTIRRLCKIGVRKKQKAAAKDTRTEAEVSFDTSRGRIGSIMHHPDFRDKMPLFLLVAEYLLDAHAVAGKNGAAITSEAVHDLQRELDTLKKQLPFLMDVKVGASADSRASNHYEDVYDQLVELFDPHIFPDQHGSYIGARTLCCSVVENTTALVQFWLNNRDTAKHPLDE